MLKAFALVMIGFTPEGEEMNLTLGFFDEFEQCDDMAREWEEGRGVPTPAQAFDVSEVTYLAGGMEGLFFVCEDPRLWEVN